jgi:hypothetical protein
LFCAAICAELIEKLEEQRVRELGEKRDKKKAEEKKKKSEETKPTAESKYFSQ